MQYKLPPITTLGRSKNCDIQVSPKLTKVSREHVQIKIYDDSMYVLYDQSTAGTFVNGKREQQIVLHDGDKISLAGVVEMQFFNGTLSSSNPDLRVTRSTAAPAPIPPYGGQQELPVPYNPPYQQEDSGRQNYIPPAREYNHAQGGGRVSSGYKVSASGALAAIIFFFFPWVLTSCGGIQVEQTGWDLAAGSTLDYGFGAEAIPGSPILFIALMAAFFVFPLLFFAYRRGMIQPLLDGIGVIAIGVAPLFVLILFYLAKQDEASQTGFYGINVEYKFGLWAVILGYIAVIIGGALNLLESNASSRNNTAHFQ